ncbi:exosome component 7 [Phyllostomus discolor]|uniref:Ribosomal RNA-processing protein 42 n=1 Tax=Phyllostomus discolor TaxID=89673 RepID=A0A833ZSW4_9CHIR|nr:exosome component 7 [Phyllostomus discolor]
MGTPKLEKPNEGYLEFFVDCSANATPEFEGRGGDDLGTEIANTLYRIFHNKSSVDLEALCISPREHCWVLYVDVLVCAGRCRAAAPAGDQRPASAFLPGTFFLQGTLSTSGVRLGGRRLVSSSSFFFLIKCST